MATSYTTISDLQKRISSRDLAALANDGGVSYTEAAAATVLSSDTTVQGVINQAITDASLQIDQILNGILDLTDSTNQAAVEQYAAYIALYLLFVRRHNCGDERNPHYQMMKSSERNLREIAKRQRRTQIDPEQPGGHAYTNITSTGGVMTDDALEHF